MDLFTGARTLISMLLLVGTLVLIHEGGHFLVARWCGVSVKVFSIGVGPRLFGFTRGGTDYRLSALPIGGYVRWVGSDPFADSGNEDEDWIDAKGSFIHKPAWQRLLIVAAGPLTNLILPLFVFTALFVAGEEQPRADIGRVEQASAAALAGVQVGDRIVGVGGTETLTWIDVYEALHAFEGGTLPLQVDRDGTEVSLTLATPAGEPVYASSLGLGDSAPDTQMVVDDPSSPAGRAGLTTGNRILTVDGAAVRTWSDVVRALAGKDQVTLDLGELDGSKGRRVALQTDSTWSPQRFAADDDTWARWGFTSATLSIGVIRPLPDGRPSAAQCLGLKAQDRLLRVGDRDVHTFVDVLKAVGATVDGKPTEATTPRPLDFVLRRGGVILTLTMQPDVIQDVDAFGRYIYIPRVGFGAGGEFLPPANVPRPYGLVAAMKRAGQETWTIGTFMVEQIGEMITGGAPVAKNLGGPVAIFDTARKAAEQGLFFAARVFAQLSLSLGVINLLPIPVLDGGQIVTYAAEWIRGRPLPWRVRERLQQVGLLFLVSLLLVVSVWDVQKCASPSEDATAPAEGVPKCG